MVVAVKVCPGIMGRVANKRNSLWERKRPLETFTWSPWQVSMETCAVHGKTNMCAESLNKLGLFFDELKRIRLWEPEASLKITDLKEESKDFVEKISKFHNASSDFLKTIQDLAVQVEKEKIKALGSSNVLKSMAKQRECQQQQYQALIMEKSAELERLRVQRQSLLKIHSEQQEMIHQIQLC